MLIVTMDDLILLSDIIYYIILSPLLTSFSVLLSKEEIRLDLSLKIFVRPYGGPWIKP